MRTGVGQAKRQATINVLARACQGIMVSRGLDFTMDDVAEAAQVSRSTVFRHFATRDELVVTAVTMGVEDYVGELPLYRGEDWRRWLHELCAVVCRTTAKADRTLLLTIEADGLSSRLQALGRDLNERRRARSRQLADELWRAAGGAGPTPEHLATVVATHFSPLFVAAVRHDGLADAAVAAGLAERAITTAVTESMSGTITGGPAAESDPVGARPN